MSIASELKHRFYRLPMRGVRKLRGWGVRGYLLESKWRGEMEAAAYSLGSGVGSVQSSVFSNEPRAYGHSPLATVHTSPETGWKPVEIHMLVGRGFWFMAAFAVASLRRQLSRPVHAWFYDDGSLEEKQAQALVRIADRADIVSAAEQEAQVERWLPEAKFPHIRRRLLDYPNLKKLTSPHLGSRGAKLVLDADVLFFAEPRELTRWLEDSSTILCATDCAESYGYSRALLEEVAGARMPRDINVGVTGLVSEEIDWNLLESWCHGLITRAGMTYYLEQALVAMLCARRPFTQLPLDAYITGPSCRQVAEGCGVMQHYVEHSKKSYLERAWRPFALRA